MVRDFVLCMVLCWVCMAHASIKRSVPEPPRVPVGPFDMVDEDKYSSPPPEPNAYGYPLYQGDIFKSRFFPAGAYKTWPNGIIPYQFHCSIENQPSVQEVTLGAMREWERRTATSNGPCIRFIPKRQNDEAYIEFVKLSGCWAQAVGYRKGKLQVSIGVGCDYHHVMVHELGHVIGFWHEQSRTDRDKYISIVRRNIIKGLEHNFDIAERQRSLGVPYDFGSIMHYPFNAFSINRNLRTIQPRVRVNDRPYVRLSDKDVLQTQRMYECTGGNHAAPPQHAPVCVDRHKSCPSWARRGLCRRNPAVRKYCQNSCNRKCPGSCLIDEKKFCASWEKHGHCKINPTVRKYCRKSCGVCSTLPRTPAPTTEATTTETTTTEATTTVSTTTEPISETTTRRPITRPNKYTGIICADRSKNCPDWKANGRCVRDIWVKRNCLLSCGNTKYCDLEPISLKGSCVEPFGISVHPGSKPQNTFKFTATSHYAPKGWTAPARSARLYLTDNRVRREMGAWCPQPGRKNQYLQIDFRRRRTVGGIATQGRDAFFEHTETYTIAFSNDGVTWEFYKEGGKIKVFYGNCDNITPVANALKYPTTARFIRIYPIKFIGLGCLRVELYGCN